MLAVAAVIAVRPIVWLHYFALLLVIVAVVQPRLGIVWFIPAPHVAGLARNTRDDGSERTRPRRRSPVILPYVRTATDLGGPRAGTVVTQPVAQSP